jgi:hypothetical protein
MRLGEAIERAREEEWRRNRAAEAERLQRDLAAREHARLAGLIAGYKTWIAALKEAEGRFLRRIAEDREGLKAEPTRYLHWNTRIQDAERAIGDLQHGSSFPEFGGLPGTMKVIGVTPPDVSVPRVGLRTAQDRLRSFEVELRKLRNE